MKLTDLLQNVGRPVAYYPSLALAVGGVKRAVFICQMLYWDGKEADRDGWIRKPQNEVTEETGLSRDETDSVRRSLVKDGLLEQERRGENGQLHFRIVKEALNEKWENHVEEMRLREIHKRENPQTGLRQTRKPDEVVSANRIEGTPTSLSIPETTTETTTERETRALENFSDESGADPAPQDYASTVSESKPSPQNSRRPIDADGGEDERYETPQFAAVLEVCGLRDDLLKLDPRSRAATAMYAAGLAETYTADQIRASRKTWPFDSAPHPKQLLQHVPKFVNSQEKTNATRNNADPLSASAIRAAREARRQAAQTVAA